MPKPTKSKRKPLGDQRERFIAAAKAAGCADDESTFRAKLGKIAKAKGEKGRI